MKTIKVTLCLVVTAVFLMLAVTSVQAQTAPKPDPKKNKSRAEVRKVADDVLNRLYEVQPLSEAALKNAPGYAVFNNTGVKIFLSGSGNERGVAVNNQTHKETFMKMTEIQAGGVVMAMKKISIVFVFDNEKAFSGFVDSGWQSGGQNKVTAKAGDKGGAMAGAVPVSDGVWMYQLTDKGLSREIPANNIKYYKDDDLN